jgi:hypothetical protein
MSPMTKTYQLIWHIQWLNGSCLGPFHHSLHNQLFEGFKTRILAKITALTLVQYINKFIFDRPINNIKNQLI